MKAAPLGITQGLTKRPDVWIHIHFTVFDKLCCHGNKSSNSSNVFIPQEREKKNGGKRSVFRSERMHEPDCDEDLVQHGGQVSVHRSPLCLLRST